jgi:N-acetyl-alpha-D-glucosaminyl L-malate synthase BshA
MKVAMVCHPGIGGSGRMATRLGQALAEAGDEVHLVSTGHPATVPREHAMHVHVVEPAGHPALTHAPVTLAVAETLVSLTRNRGLDVVHAHYAVPWASAAQLAAQVLGGRAPALVTTLHGSDVFQLGPQYAETTRFALGASDAVTAVSHALRDAARRDLAFDAPIEVVWNFVDRPPPAPPRQGVPPVLAHVSNFRPLKRPLDAVEVFARVRSKRAARLRLVGDGPLRPHVEARVEELGIAEYVEWVGPVEDSQPVLTDVRALLAPSEREAFGLAPLEAQACGVPVVGSAVDGLPEVVLHGETGFLHPVGDIEAMAKSARTLLDDEPLHARMGESARTRALQCFDRDASVARYREVYEVAQRVRRRRASHGT